MDGSGGGLQVHDHSPEEHSPERKRGRRSFLKVGVAAATGAALFRLDPRQAEAAPKFIEMGASNDADGLTTLTTKASHAFRAVSRGGRGLHGKSRDDVGVLGESTNYIGVVGEGAERGVHGYSPVGIGMRAASDAGVGIAATSGSPPPSPPGPPSPAPPIAVLAESFNAGGVGVVGKGPNGGVAGFSETGVAVKADAVAGLAMVATSQGAQALLASTSALNVAAIEGVTTSTDPGTFNTGVFGRVERGHGVQGFATQGIGVKGQSEDMTGSGIGVLGDAAAGVAVKGFSRDATGIGIGIGVLGEAVAGVGIKGFVGAPGGFGVIGEAPVGSGVFGSSVTGNGLHGYSASGLALYAQGRVWLDSLVLVPLAAGSTSGVVVGVAHATGGSFAIGTIQGGDIGAAIQRISIPAAGTLEVHLTTPATADGYAAVLVLN